MHEYGQGKGWGVGVSSPRRWVSCAAPRGGQGGQGGVGERRALGDDPEPHHDLSIPG